MAYLILIRVEEVDEGKFSIASAPQSNPQATPGEIRVGILFEEGVQELANLAAQLTE